MFAEVVRSRKCFLADLAHVRLDARVAAPVPRQLVGPREAPRAALLVAHVWFLARVPPVAGACAHAGGGDRGASVGLIDCGVSRAAAVCVRHGGRASAPQVVEALAHSLI